MATTYRFSPSPVYPVHVDAERAPALSRWLWLVKWVLVIPHYLILVLLWAAFVVMSAVALVAIVVTGRYPRAVFEFNVGVLRWTWRVSYYSYGALGTDEYPPFTLAEVEDYPAHLRVDYPEHLSRGLALVKWWLLAIPHYLVVALLAGGAATVVWQATNTEWRWEGGLIGILVLIAGVILLVTGAYPRPLYDLILGLNRWVIRVAAYAGLMTDTYPPFRLDMGEHEGVALYTGPPPAPPDAPPSAFSRADRPAPPDGAPGGAGWTAGRVTAVVAGAVLAVLGVSCLGAGGIMGFAHLVLREDGYVTSRAYDVTSDGYAVVMGEVVLEGAGVPYWPDQLLGDVRIRATTTDDGEIFLGVAQADDVAAYLDGVQHDTATGLGRQRVHDGGAPAVPPEQTGIWADQASGTGTQAVTGQLTEGRWVAVVMTPAAGLDAQVDVGATIPWLAAAAVLSLLLGALVLAAAVAVIVTTSRRVLEA